MVREGQHVGHTPQLRDAGNVPAVRRRPVRVPEVQDTAGNMRTTRFSGFDLRFLRLFIHDDFF